MKLLVIRHGIAEEADLWARTGEPEAQRPLTDEGRKKMKKNARGLSELVPGIDLIATSPLTRAVQTAEIVARQYDGVATVVTDVLEPAQSYPALLTWLNALDQPERVAVVGHEPHLSGLVSWLLTGSETRFLELKKGAACLLEFERQAAPGQGVLLWLLRPDQLRAMTD